MCLLLNRRLCYRETEAPGREGRRSRQQSAGAEPSLEESKALACSTALWSRHRPALLPPPLPSSPLPVVLGLLGQEPLAFALLVTRFPGASSPRSVFSPTHPSAFRHLSEPLLTPKPHFLE